jgi:Superinfection immunity protein
MFASESEKEPVPEPSSPTPATLAEPPTRAPNQHWRVRLLWWRGWPEGIPGSPAQYRGLTELQKFDFWSWIGYSVFSALMWLLFLAVGVFAPEPLSTGSSRYENIGELMFAYCLFQLGLYLYLLPTSIAIRRQRPNRMAIFALDFLLGWTLVGWAVALSWALTSKDGSS